MQRHMLQRHSTIYLLCVLEIGRSTVIAYGGSIVREREKISTLDSYNFCISTPVLKFGTTVFVISQLLTGQVGSRSNPMAVNDYGVEIAHTMGPSPPPPPSPTHHTHTHHEVARDDPSAMFSEVCYDSGSPHLASLDSERACWTCGKACRDSPPPPSFFVQTSFCVARLGSHPILNILVHDVLFHQ